MKTAVHQYEDKLLEFAYGELPTHEANAVEAHVRGCTRCADSLAEIRSVRSTMQQLPLAEAPTAGLESLLAYADQQAARNRAAAPKSWWQTWFTPVRLASFASLAALLVAGVFAWRSTLTMAPSESVAMAKAEVAKVTPNKPVEEPKAKDAKEAELDEAVPQRQQDLASPALATGEGRPEPAMANAPAPGTANKLADQLVDEGSGAREVRTKSVPKGSVSRRSLGSASGGGGVPADDYSNVGTKSKKELAASSTPTEAPPAEAQTRPPTTVADKSKNDEDSSFGLQGTYQKAPEQAKTPVAAAPAPPAPKVVSLPMTSPAFDGKAASGDERSRTRREADDNEAPDTSLQASLVNARAAGQHGERVDEIRYATQALQAGAKGADRLEMLKRLCDAYEARGEQALADPYCDALLVEFPSSDAAQRMSKRRGFQQAPQLERSDRKASESAQPAEQKKAKPAPSKKATSAY